MSKMFSAALLLVSALGFVPAQKLEPCQPHLRADISISSETLNDYDYQQKYGYSKKGKTIYGLQQQIQQQIQVPNLANLQNIAIPEPEPTKPEKEPEIIWHLNVPSAAQSVKLMRVVPGLVSDVIEWDRENLTNGSDTNRDNIRKDITKSVAPTPDEWFLVCVVLKTMKKGEVSSCQSCALEQADSHGNAVTGRLLEYTQTKAHLLYTVGNLPVSEAKIRTIARPESRLERCFDYKPNDVESEDLIQPFASVDVELDIDPSFGYAITYELLLGDSEITEKIQANPNAVSSSLVRGSYRIPESCEGEKVRNIFSG